MIQRRGVLGLPPEALVEVRIAGEVGTQDLDRHLAVQSHITRAVHLRHPAETEDLAQLVAVGQLLRRGHRAPPFTPMPS